MTIKKQDKVFQNLQRIIDSLEFKSEEDARKFIDGLMGKPIPSFPKES